MALKRNELKQAAVLHGEKKKKSVLTIKSCKCVIADPKNRIMPLQTNVSKIFSKEKKYNHKNIHFVPFSV